MKRFLIFVLLIAAIVDASAQVHKKFFNKNGKETKDSTKAVSYMLYRKEGADSLWSVVMLDRRNFPIMRGVYLDDDLTIPYGKFVYYQQVLEQSKVDDHHSTVDTTFKVKETGFFINGLKEGIWMDYYPNGAIKAYVSYENNVLNGVYELYDDNGKLYSRGNYIKGLKEGDWNVFQTDSSVMEHRLYVHGWPSIVEQFDEKDQMYNAYPGFNFEYHIYKLLKKLGLPAAHGNVVVSFTITKDGELIKPALNMGVNPILDEAIIEAIKNSPKWVPARLKNKKIEQKLTLAFEYDSAKL